MFFQLHGYSSFLNSWVYVKDLFFYFETSKTHRPCKAAVKILIRILELLQQNVNYHLSDYRVDRVSLRLKNALIKFKKNV